MTPRIDQQEPVRRFEQPEPRFGSEHVLRDEIPAINPEIIDMLEYQETPETEASARYASRKGAIAVADVVSVQNPSRSNGSDKGHGLYL